MDEKKTTWFVSFWGISRITWEWKKKTNPKGFGTYASVHKFFAYNIKYPNFYVHRPSINTKNLSPLFTRKSIIQTSQSVYNRQTSEIFNSWLYWSMKTIFFISFKRVITHFMKFIHSIHNFMAVGPLTSELPPKLTAFKLSYLRKAIN